MWVFGRLSNGMGHGHLPHLDLSWPLALITLLDTLPRGPRSRIVLVTVRIRIRTIIISVIMITLACFYCTLRLLISPALYLIGEALQ